MGAGAGAGGRRPDPARTPRCHWCGSDPLYVAYHDEEWGAAERDEQRLFEFLVLEGAQAGLSWLTILRKRANYRQAMAGFDAARLARFDPGQVAALLANPGIVRNRLKVEAAVANARVLVGMHEAGETLSELLWSFVDGAPVQNDYRSASDIPTETPVSQALSRELRRRGFRFCGPTICYALMQACGLVNDHVVDCFRHRQLGGGDPA